MNGSHESQRPRSTGHRVVALLLLLTAAVAVSPARSQGPELRVALADFSGDTLDSIHGGPGRLPFHVPLYDFLLLVDSERRLVPGLAQSWSVSDDGLEVRMGLRRDVRFHNGDLLTSADVASHFERLRRGTGAHAGSLLRLLKSIETPDRHTVVFRLTERSPDFLGYLTPLDTTVGGITPKSYSERVGDSGFAAAPIGSGPWRLRDFRRGVYYRFDAVPHAFRGPGGFSTLRLMLVPEESTRIAMLRRGEVDIADVSIDGARQLRSLGLGLIEIPDAFIAYLSFIGVWEERAAARKLPTRMENQNVRRALAMAINRPDILRYLLDNHGRLASTLFMFPGDTGYDEPWVSKAQVPYDPEQARRLLAKAGYPKGFKQRIYAVPLVGASWFPKVLEVVASNWADIGLDVELMTMEWGALAPLVYGRPDSALGAAFGLRTGRTPFPVGKLMSYVTASGSGSIASVNWPQRYDALSREADPARREQLYQSLSRDLSATNAVIPLFFMNALYGVSRPLDGCDPIDGWPSLALTWECLRPQAVSPSAIGARGAQR